MFRDFHEFIDGFLESVINIKAFIIVSHID